MRAYIRKAARRFAFEALTESGKGLTYVELRLASVELCFGWFVSTCKDECHRDIFCLPEVYFSEFLCNFASMKYDSQLCATLLESHKIKPTANRILVCRALAEAKQPMSLSELECEILSLDKSSVFRVLSLFREHHLVHVLEDGSDGVRYEICHSTDGHEHDDDQHVHFFCECCRRTFCINDIPIPNVSLPQGYVLESINYMAKGLCPKCASKKETIR